MNYSRLGVGVNRLLLYEDWLGLHNVDRLEDGLNDWLDIGLRIHRGCIHRLLMIDRGCIHRLLRVNRGRLLVLRRLLLVLLRLLVLLLLRLLLVLLLLLLRLLLVLLLLRLLLVLLLLLLLLLLLRLLLLRLRLSTHHSLCGDVGGWGFRIGGRNGTFLISTSDSYKSVGFVTDTRGYEDFAIKVAKITVT
jgi:hypothetical protein